jgi:predicted DNA-binding antitoxin AbrB/MazE fold protein
MSRTIRATYRQGAFIPAEPCDLPEGAEVELAVQGPFYRPPLVTDPVERARLLQQLTERMQQNPLPPDAPRFSRDELHARR